MSIIFNHKANGRKVTINEDCTGRLVIMVSVERSEARGDVSLVETSYGYEVSIAGIPHPVCYIDLFQPAMDHDNGQPILAVCDAVDGEFVAKYTFSSAGTQRFDIDKNQEPPHAG